MPIEHSFLRALVHRPFGIALLLSLSAPATAQQIFVAPTSSSIIASSEQSAAGDMVHLLYVTNESTVPIIVFGVVLTSCENVRQWCGGQKTNILIPAGVRRTVARVEPKSSEHGFAYRWTFSFRADSADAQAMAAMREHGFIVESDGPPRFVPRATTIDTASPPGIEQPVSREPLTSEERSGMRSQPVPGDVPTAPPAFRFKVFYGSVLGSTMMPGAPIQLTGPCINPAESAKYERDARISRAPWRPPVVSASFATTTLPAGLRDSVIREGDVLVRWVADTTGETLPGSVNVLESPHGLMSVKVCTAVIGARATPARDKAGHAIRAWVQMPLKIAR